MTGIQPDYSPQEWQYVLNEARKAYHQNPNDQEAKKWLDQATQALTAVDHLQDEPPTGDRSALGAAAGVGRGILDIPQSIYTAVRHPIKTLGAMSGVSNIPHAWNTMFHDPEANWAEKLDAAVRATPLNIGYAPERAAIETMSNPATSSFDRARSLTNVGSLALFGLGARKPRAGLPPLNAEQFGGPPVTSGPTGAPPRAPLPPMPEAPPTAALEPMPIGDMSLTPRVKPPMADPTLTPPASGVNPPKFANPEPIPSAGLQEGMSVGAAGKPRGISVEGPPLKPVTPAMEAFSEVRTGVPRAKPQGSGGVAQKGVQFGAESPLSPASRAQVKGLLGEMSREPGSPGELLNGLAKGNTVGMLGFSIGPFLAWEIMRRTIRPMIDNIAERGMNPKALADAIQSNPKLQALQSALIRAYMAGDAEHTQQIAQQLAQELMMQNPQQEQ